MMHFRVILLMFCASFGSTGCVSNLSDRMHMGWKFGDEIIEEPLLEYYSNRPDLLREPAASKEDRNRIAKDLMYLVDAEFRHDMQALYWGRGQANFFADLAVLGLNAAGAVVGGESIKSILAVASAALVGTKAKFNEEFFRDKTTEALVLKMEILRNTKKVEILLRLGQPLPKYSLRDAIIDINEYYNSGTIMQAMVEIVRGLEPDQKTSKEKLKEAENKAFGIPPEETEQPR